MPKADEFRAKADECLQRAAASKKPEDKAMLLQMAQQWLMMAQNAEKRRAQAPKPDDEPGR